MPQPSPTDRHRDGLSSVVERNIHALVERRKHEESARTWHERAAAGISEFAGSIRFVYLHLALFSAWIGLNTLPLPLPRFDPSLVILAMFASVEAIFLSTFVLMNQNRMAKVADKRAELDLQISLLAEHEITRLIAMVNALCEQAGIQSPKSDELAELQRDVAPEKVLDRIDETG
jgi:uncharacterized membrane protein